MGSVRLTSPLPRTQDYLCLVSVVVLDMCIPMFRHRITHSCGGEMNWPENQWKSIFRLHIHCQSWSNLYKLVPELLLNGQSINQFL